MDRIFKFHVWGEKFITGVVSSGLVALCHSRLVARKQIVSHHGCELFPQVGFAKFWRGFFSVLLTSGRRELGVFIGLSIF